MPVLARKPGALRNGAPFKDWPLPGAIEKVRRKLAGSDDGDRQMVKILTAVLTDGLQAVEAACAESLAAGIASADVILNALARRSQPLPVVPIILPALLANGIDLVHFGVLMVMAVVIGQLTPPVAIALIITSRIAGVDQAKIFRENLPFFWVIIGFTLVLMLFPSIATWLPSISG